MKIENYYAVSCPECKGLRVVGQHQLCPVCDGDGRLVIKDDHGSQSWVDLLILFASAACTMGALAYAIHWAMVAWK